MSKAFMFFLMVIAMTAIPACADKFSARADDTTSYYIGQSRGGVVDMVEDKAGGVRCYIVESRYASSAVAISCVKDSP